MAASPETARSSTVGSSTGGSAGLDSGIEFEIHPSQARVPAAERERALEAPGFGEVFTDHMITLRWSAERGWHDGRLEPYGPFSLDPATTVFHYGQELFEGMKAYRAGSGEVVLFRPRDNAARFNAGCRRMAMPELPEAAFLRAVELLVSTDKDWIPSGEGNSLYLRPFMIATQRGLGVNHPSSEFLFCVIASPAGAYFGATTAVKVWLSEDYTRAAPGGTGAVKCGGNYAAAFAAQQQAAANGCDQVVWLDAASHEWVEEMGGMNLCFVYGSGSSARIVTPALSGTLLPGITRDSLLRLAPTLGIPATEGRISVPEWRDGCASGEITEVFACGTAAVITPVGSVLGASGGWTIGSGAPGPVSMRLRSELIGIQYGQRPDPFGWLHKVA
ncbi:MAG: branched-chain amino acid aminotransferase [Nocardiopsaceae bacterium]|nr:branched-chain amino acid aminotransferase [Nocardiopsaceae bacterium]